MSRIRNIVTVRLRDGPISTDNGKFCFSNYIVSQLNFVAYLFFHLVKHVR